MGVIFVVLILNFLVTGMCVSSYIEYKDTNFQTLCGAIYYAISTPIYIKAIQNKMIFIVATLFVISNFIFYFLGKK